MKIIKKKAELCTGCRACMTACSQVLYKVDDPEKSAIRIIENKEKPGSYEILSCTHCGECIPPCNPKAMYRAKNGAIRVDKQKCVGCYICVGFCPENALHVNVEINEPIKCIACGACTRACPTGAIYMEEK
ncbi:MAG TPA: 4Fe-4S binding protein [Thermoanaerobacterales bacterium]|nr:4Fe-4S binding protein [Thermoanaerobacterales bacterium]